MRDKKLRDYLGIEEKSGMLSTVEYSFLRRIQELETKLRKLFEHLDLIYIDKPSVNLLLPRIEKTKKAKTRTTLSSISR